jgi:2-polyprenyl-3-methyl-5-hydroxy-6-metoxy-1,4-benzoquinol methylase
MRTYYSNTRHDVLAIIPDGPKQNVLEIGGGDFGTILSLRETGEFETWGADIRKSSAKLDHMVVGSITDPEVQSKLPITTFDLIIANDVLEHVENTEAFVDVVYRTMKPGGFLALSVPNIRQVRTFYHVMLRGTFPRDDAGLFDRTHLRWFCKNDVISTFSSDRFRLVLAKSVGRAVPKLLQTSFAGELLGLQNLFLFEKT